VSLIRIEAAAVGADNQAPLRLVVVRVVEAVVRCLYGFRCSLHGDGGRKWRVSRFRGRVCCDARSLSLNILYCPLRVRGYVPEDALRRTRKEPVVREIHRQRKEAEEGESRACRRDLDEQPCRCQRARYHKTCEHADRGCSARGLSPLVEVAYAFEEVCQVGELHHEPGADDVDDVVGPFVVAALFDEFVEGEGGACSVFAVFDVLSQILEGVAVDAALDDEVEYCGELYGLVSDCVYG
jgi:hypothetical protein